jgi:small subunit ribosomal protein S14
LKTLQKHSSISKQRQYQIGLALSKIKAKASRVRVRNRCVLTGRPRGVYNFFKVSRIMVKELAAQALLPGVKKAC